MFLVTVLIFVAMVALASAAGMKLYVRPKEAMERVVGAAAPADVQGEHPSLAFHEIIKRLGNFVPQSPKDVTVMQRRLIRAGIRKEGALKVLYGAKVATGIIFPLLVLTFMAGVSTDSGNKIALGLAAAAVGFFGPNEYVRRLAADRSGHARRDRLDRRAAAVSREGIRIAGIDHECARLAERQRLAAPFHLGRRAFAVGGDAGDGRAGIERGIGQVGPFPRFVARARYRDPDARDRRHFGEGGGEGGLDIAHASSPSSGKAGSVSDLHQGEG